MRSFFYICLLAVLVFIFGACKKTKPPFETRSFLLGVTPWPPDFTKKGYDLAYDFIDEHCDLVSHHFDDGIPWNEAYYGLPMPKKFQEDLDRRKQKTPTGKKILLSVAPLKISRKEKAGYYSSPDPSSPVSEWEKKNFRDSTVIQAYVNFIAQLILELKADYINYGVESNSREWSENDFDDYRFFLSQVYLKLKGLYPNKPFFISFMVSPEKKFLETAKLLESYTDWITLSAYPYTYIGSVVHGSSSPDLIPDDLFPSYRNINSSKPFAFAETGYIAEDLEMNGVSKEGNAQWQEDYLQYLFKFCQKNEAEFIVWFCAYDYDDAVNTFGAIGYTDQLAMLWKDTGLFDEKLIPRPSLQTWEAWRKLPIQ